MTFSDLLLNWYMSNRRSLPWRDHPDPYAVWVSEIMLQQTRVDTVLGYYARWMTRFPTVNSLAEAEQQDVLNLWEGLGYYSRARNLHRAARIVVENYHGRVPDEVKTLKKLPGIGPYTAGAIASLAYNRDEPIVDGNVRRVLSRVFDVDLQVDRPEGQKVIWRLAEENLPGGRARDYNQALMELGALVCLPRTPACSKCPVQKLCKSYSQGLQLERPVLKPKAKVPHITVAAAVIRQNGQILIAQRPQNGLLGGMWEFPGGKQERDEALEACLEREICEELGVSIAVGKQLGVFRHAYTHFKVTLHAFECLLKPDDQKLQEKEVAAVRWVQAHELKDFPMGKIDRQISSQILKERDFRGQQ